MSKNSNSPNNVLSDNTIEVIRRQIRKQSDQLFECRFTEVKRLVAENVSAFQVEDEQSLIQLAMGKLLDQSQSDNITALDGYKILNVFLDELIQRKKSITERRLSPADHGVLSNLLVDAATLPCTDITGKLLQAGADPFYYQQIESESESDDFNRRLKYSPIHQIIMQCDNEGHKDDNTLRHIEQILQHKQYYRCNEADYYEMLLKALAHNKHAVALTVLTQAKAQKLDTVNILNKMFLNELAIHTQLPTPLELAIRSGETQVVEQFLAYGADAYAYLSEAILSGNKDIIAMVSEHMSMMSSYFVLEDALGARDEKIRQALLRGLIKVMLEKTVSQLNDRKTSVKPLAHSGNIRGVLSKLLHDAAEKGQPECIDLVLQYHRVILRQDSTELVNRKKDGVTALFRAEINGHTDIVEKLLGHFAVPLEGNSSQETVSLIADTMVKAVKADNTRLVCDLIKRLENENQLIQVWSFKQESVDKNTIERCLSTSGQEAPSESQKILNWKFLRVQAQIQNDKGRCETIRSGIGQQEATNETIMNPVVDENCYSL